MVNQNVIYNIKIQERGFCSDQEVYFEMNASAPLSSDQRLLLASQTGQILLAFGSLLADPAIIDDPSASQTGQNLLNLGRKLIGAGSCCSKS